MDINIYRNFIRLVDCGSVTAAAKELNLAQPALTVRMKKLEEEYGTRLFEKGQGRHQLGLTPAGKLFYRHAIRLVEDEEKLRRELQAKKEGLTGRFAVKIFDFEMVEWVEDFFPLLKERFPHLVPEIHFSMLDNKRRNSREVELLVLTAQELADYGQVHDVLFSKQLQYYVVCRRDTSWLDPDAESVELQELDGAPLALPANDSNYRLGRRMQLNGLKFNLVSYVNNYVTALTFVIGGGALTVLPESKHGRCLKEISFIPFKGMNEERYMVIGKEKGLVLPQDWQQYLDFYIGYHKNKK